MKFSGSSEKTKEAIFKEKREYLKMDKFENIDPSIKKTKTMG